MALGGGLLAALLLKGADGTLRYSLHRTGTELLFVPLPDGLRARAKPIIDVRRPARRAGRGLAADPGRDQPEPRQHRARRGGGRAVHRVDRVGRGAAGPLPRPLPRPPCARAPCAPRVDLPALDLGSLEALFTALNSRDDAEVMGAMELLADERPRAPDPRAHPVPPLARRRPARARAFRAPPAAPTSSPWPTACSTHEDARCARPRCARARRCTPDEAAAARARRPTRSPLVPGHRAGGPGRRGLGHRRGAGQRWTPCMTSPSPGRPRRALAAAIRAQHGPCPPSSRSSCAWLDGSATKACRRRRATAMGALRAARRSCPPSCPCSRPRHLRAGRARRAGRHRRARAGRAPTRRWRDDTCPTRCAATCRAPSAASRPRRPRPLLLAPARRRGGRDGALQDPARPGPPGRREPGAAPGPPPCSHAGDGAHAGGRLPPRPLADGAGRAARPRTRGGPPPATSCWSRCSATRRRTPSSASSACSASSTAARTSRRSTAGCAARAPRCGRAAASCWRTSSAPPARGHARPRGRRARPRPACARAAAFYRAAPLGYDDLLARLIEEPGETVRCLAAYHVGELGLSALRPRLEAVRAESGAGLFLLRVVERALACCAARPGGSNMLDEGRLLGHEQRISGSVERVLLPEAAAHGQHAHRRRSSRWSPSRCGERFFPKGAVLLREGEPAGRHLLPGRRAHPSDQPRAGASATRGPGWPWRPFHVLARDERGLGAVAETDTLALELSADTLFEHLRGALRDPPPRPARGLAPDRRASREVPEGGLPPHPLVRGPAHSAARAGPRGAHLLPAEVAGVRAGEHQRPGPARPRAHGGAHAAGHAAVERGRSRRAGARSS